MAICSKESTQLSIELKLNIDSEQLVAMVFTSGTSGSPKPNEKSWGQLFENAKRVKERFQLNSKQQHSLVATVPPQHMFGFETTIIYPLVSGIAIHAGRPFYPLDVRQSLAETPSPRILVTIPLHLKACLSIKEEWPDMDFVISATATMPLKVATDAEKILRTQVLEIYGCSEVGAIATRQMTLDSNWRLLKNFYITTLDEQSMLSSPGYHQRIALPDYLDVLDECYFKLIGRNSDLIKIGGKRGSLSNLTSKLRSIEGVKDGIFLMPNEQEGKRLRLAAFAVASDMDEIKLRHILTKHIDSVFLPRPLIIVEQLPYNESGKLPHASLLALLNQHLNRPSVEETS